jgi:cell wall-associated NlpC family hydrolase
MVGVPVEGGYQASLKRGDLIFWRGHVGILLDRTRIVHASGHHMTVVIEPVAEAIGRIARKHGSPTSVRRVL